MLTINDLQVIAGLFSAARCVDRNAENPAGTTYYGFYRQDGSWFIMRQVVSGNDTEWRFAKGDSDYASAWSGRTGLTYGYTP